MAVTRISQKNMIETLETLFKHYHFTADKAKRLAEVFTENSLCGVASHGVNRVVQFIDFVEKKLVQKDAEAQHINSFGAIERWDGNGAPGITNAITCTDRAITLAKTHGMGIVALKNTNHWLRGGYYGWQAAKADCISILFTNTKPNMPAWGGQELRLGNNPFIIAIPRKKGHVVLDMAVSQYSFGKINDYKLKGEQLPYDGGWDTNGQLTKDPNAILETERSLPMGLWKGSALSIVLDMLATVLSGGKSTYQLGLAPYETGVSQVFICLHQPRLGDSDLHERLLNEIIDFTHSATPVAKDSKTYYPGERTALIRHKNLKEGIPIHTSVWQSILNLIDSTAPGEL